MSMERTRLLADFWRYLPVFRVVAETGSLAEASRTLHVSPSALSRSISLLEDALEVELFSRAGRTLTLTSRGEAFLERVREAMRTVHDGYEASRGSLTAGPLHVYVAPEIGASVLQALVTGLRPRPEVEVRSQWVSPDDVAPALRRGELDLAIVQRGIDDSALDAVTVGEQKVGVFHAPEVAPDREWVVLDSALVGRFDDGWRGAPAALAEAENEGAVDGETGGAPETRTVAVRAASGAEVHALCLAGVGTAMLPVALAEPDVARGRLVEVPDRRARIPLVAVRRRELVADAASLAIEALRTALGES